MEDHKNKGTSMPEPQPADMAGSALELGPSSAIGKRLKAYYDDVAGEPVPDRFLSLLDALDAAESHSKTTKRD
ncbi:NepR family anti-sigma factor [Aureimonas sp. AU12]|jgi:hypothetical protein|uniref:NepR family anti-sigma factor n=1 Tax=Aureimonas sp. AU12 TaxID=1638161 RepID=UPI00078271C2|nr:NepR family anti-sigma factor [Aureimonas sp. AU12]